MIDDDYYFFLLQLRAIITEQIKRQKRKKKKYSDWQSMSDDLEYIINYYEKEMDEYLSKYK